MDSYNIFSDISEIRKRLDKLEKGNRNNLVVQQIVLKNTGIELRNYSGYKLVDRLILDLDICFSNLEEILNKYDFGNFVHITELDFQSATILMYVIIIMIKKGYKIEKGHPDSINTIELII